MAKLWRFLAALAVVTLAGVFAIRYSQLNRPLPPPPRTEPPIIGPHFAEAVAGSIAEKLSQQVARYHSDHGRFPAVADFWNCIGIQPIHNPINGKSNVVSMRLDLDAREMGWVYDQEAGAVYPGAVFNSANASTTKP